MSHLFDIACNFSSETFDNDLQDVIQRAIDNKVNKFLIVSASLKEVEKVYEIYQQNNKNCFFTIGTHPHHANEFGSSSSKLMTNLVNKFHPHSIGETGLDYFRVQGDLTWQRDRFRTHIKAAVQSNLPLIIHTRNAAEDTLKIMREEGADKVGGVMHCFTESLDVALEAIKLNFYISFSGIVTFKNATELKEVVKSIPLDRILIETDSPYLAPVPYRGKMNDPSNVIYVAEEIAKLKNISVEEVGQVTTNNFFRLFSKCSPSN